MKPAVQSRWGTPLTPVALKVMMLGAGELGKEVIIALQRLGVEVIAVDRYPNAPGHQVAHHAEVADMTDPNALQTLIDRHQPDVIVPEIEAIATDLLVRLEEEQQLRVTPTARAAHLTMNREGIRRLAAETLGLKTSPYRFADSLEELHAGVRAVGLPCVVKPVMSSSGHGQSLVRSPDDVDKAWEIAQTGGRTGAGRVIVEGWIEFEREITLLTARSVDPDGQVITQFCEPIGHRQVDGDYVESWQPEQLNDTALARAQDMALAVTQDLGGLGIFGVEFFIQGDTVWFSEVSPRPHDTGLVTLVSQKQNEFEIHARALLGLPVDVSLLSPGASCVIYGGIEADAVVFDGMAQALAIPDTELRLFGKPQSYLTRRMGVALARAPDVTLARENARAASACIQIQAPSTRE